ncbi:MAG TPA: universal stress protein [Thermohalobaculum sp.]|nr:universal stress protein [Thermohalobaculum sp.]
MFRKIMVPVDLGHLDRLQNALDTAGKLSGLYDAPVTYIAVTTETPSEHARTPDEFQKKLEAFAADQAGTHGIAEADARSYASHDPSADLDDALMNAVSETGADLVIIGSHKPGFAEHIFASHAGHMATHAPVSVMVVR